MITTKNYKTLDDAYTFFNEKLFDNKLPECLITFQRRKVNKLGYFHSKQYHARDDNNNVVSELSLNPDSFYDRTDQEILSTLVHEMCHAWEIDVEKKNTGTYHDKHWGNKMELVGLIPSNTGKSDGKKTGIQMTHYINPEGKFIKVSTEFLENNKLEWNGNKPVERIKKERNKTKFKFHCGECNQVAWGKEDANLMCGNCSVEMEIEL
jgi:predicted SprT family Zn-dependent metalloprotease